MKKLSALLVLLLMLAGCESVYFYPHRNLYFNPLMCKFHYEDIIFQSRGARLHGWFVWAEGDAVGTVIQMHGNAQNISTHINSAIWLAKEGFNVFSFDYRGYGLSEGSPDLDGLMADGLAAIEYVISRDDIDPARLVILGQSLGSEVATYAAVNSPHRENIKALVLDSPVSSLRRVAREKLGGFFLTWPVQYPLSWMLKNSYAPEDLIAQVSPIPVIIVHGADDPVVPVSHGKKVFDRAREPKVFIPVKGVDHVEGFTKLEIRQRVVKLLKNDMDAILF